METDHTNLNDWLKQLKMKKEKSTQALTTIIN